MNEIILLVIVIILGMIVLFLIPFLIKFTKQNKEQVRLDLIKNERLVLSNCDRDIFIKALESPAEPNKALMELFH